MTEINFKPLNGILVLELPSIDEKTESGIIKSPEMVKEEEKKTDNFLVIKALADNVNAKLELPEGTIKVGDKVLVELQQANLLEVDGINYVSISYRALLGYRI